MPNEPPTTTNVLAASLHADAVVGEEFPASTTALPSMAKSTASLRSLALTPIYSEPVRASPRQAELAGDNQKTESPGAVVSTSDYWGTRAHPFSEPLAVAATPRVRRSGLLGLPSP
jgi:hypothetical protein